MPRPLSLKDKLNNPTAMSFLGKISQSRKGDIHWLWCKDIKGRDCYYILQCPKEKLQIIIKSQSDIHDLGSHAAILAKGFGHEPAGVVWAMLEAQYGVKAEDFSDL
jgi:hypothetical protein